MNNINQFISKYTLFAIIIKLTTIFTLSPLLADTPSIGSYISKSQVNISKDEIIPVGTEVQFLGVITVPESVSKSGQLATFQYNSRIYNADANLFYYNENITNYMLSETDVYDEGNTAAICTTFLYPEGKAVDISKVDLASFINITSQNKVINEFNIRQPVNLNSGWREGSSRWRKDTNFCIAGLRHSTDYEISILEGLPVSGFDTNGPLANTLKFFTRTPDRKPSIQINAAKNILPTSSNSKIPVSTINISKLNIDIYEIDQRSITEVNYLFKNLSTYDIKYSLPFYGKKVVSNEIEISKTLNNEKKFNIDLNKYLKKSVNGVFVAILSDQKDAYINATKWIMKSDVAITSYYGEKTTNLFFTNFQTSNSIKNIDIKILAKNNRILFEGSSINGHIEVSSALLKGINGHAPKYLIASNEDSNLSILPFENLTSKPQQFKNGLIKQHNKDVYITTERAFYRAGEVIKATGIIKSLKLEASSNKKIIIELIKPDGTVDTREVIETNKFGLFLKDFDIKKSSSLGNYEIRVSDIDETKIASHFIQVQDYVPLTIDAELEVKERSPSEDDLYEVEISANYFSGGPANDLGAEIIVEVKTTNTILGNHLKDFKFGKNDAATSVELNTYSNLTLDSNGKANKIIKTKFASKPTDLLEMHIKGIVFDIGGRANKAQKVINLKTNNSFVGISSNFGTQIDDQDIPSFKIVNVDRYGNNLPINGVTYKLVKVSYGFDWYYDNRWRYRKTRLSNTLVESGNITNKNFSLKTKADWGSYEIIVRNSDGFETTFPFYSGWGSNAKPANEPENLQINVQKINSNIGKLRVNIPYSGRLQIITASNDIISQQSIDVEKGPFEKEFSIPDIEPGINILATLIRPISTGTEHLPQIALGTAWLKNLSDGRQINNDIVVKNTSRSNEPIEVNLISSAKNGYAVLMMVDEGIHAINKFKNIDPREFFYGPRELNIGFKSNFGQLIKQDETLKTLNVGGDEMRTSGSIPKSDFFKSIAVRSPILEIENGNVSYVFDRPEMEGRLRLVAITLNNHGLGYAEKNITIKDPISLDISLPRFVAVGDTTYGKLAVRSNISTNKASLLTSIDGRNNNVTFSLSKGQQTQSSIEFKPTEEGNIPINISLNSNDLSTVRNFNLVSRNSSYPLYEYKSLQLNPRSIFGRSITNVRPLVTEDFNLNKSNDFNVSLSVGPNAGANLSQVLDSLNRYPYGCIEQVSSTTRGLITRAIFLKSDDEIKKKINIGINKILAKQKTSGAFGYWDKNSMIYDEYQAYAVETLIMGLEYSNNKAEVQKAISASLNYLFRNSMSDRLTQLYTYGVLANAGYEVTSRARYLIDIFASSNNLDKLSLAYWASSSLNDVGRMSEINKTFREILSKTRFSKELNKAHLGWKDTSSFNFNKMNISKRFIPLKFGYLLTKLEETHKSLQTQEIIELTYKYLSSEKYRSTFDNAKLIQMQSERVNNSINQKIYIDGVMHEINSDQGIPITIEQLKNGFEVEHSSKPTLVLTLEIVGKRISTKPINNGFIVEKYITDTDGMPLKKDLNKPIKFDQGQLLNVTILIKAENKNINNGQLLLTDLLPSGFEIESENSTLNTRRCDSKAYKDFLTKSLKNRTDYPKETYLCVKNGSNKPGNVQLMDDRYVAHFNDNNWRYGRDSLISYVVRASYSGEVVIPDAHVEFMYSPEINGRSSITEAIVEAR